MAPSLRPARAADIDRLVEIEARVFAHDRISRRSFRQLIDRETADTIVAEKDGAIVGYCMVLYRRGSGVARLYSIAVDPEAAGAGFGRALLAAAERAAYDRARLVLRLELREDNERAFELYARASYRRIGREDDYYEDGAAALRMEKILRGTARPPASVPYYEQTVDFSCGPCCLMMAKAFYEPEFRPDPVMEIRMWREATTVFMMSGPGGCEPFGLAVTAFEHGLSARVIVSFHGALFLQSVRSHEKRRVMELAQVDFRSRADVYGIAVDYRSFTLDDLRAALAGGNLVLVLISGFLMFGKKVPHWVLVIGDDDEHLIIHDPWVEDEHGETAADAANIPIPHGIFMSMAQFGRPGLRSAVILGKRRQQ